MSSSYLRVFWVPPYFRTIPVPDSSLLFGMYCTYQNQILYVHRYTLSKFFIGWVLCCTYMPETNPMYLYIYKDTGCPNKHGNSVTNSISSFQIILGFSIVIPTEKAVLFKIFVCCCCCCSHFVCLCFDYIRLYLVKQENSSIQTD